MDDKLQRRRGSGVAPGIEDAALSVLLVDDEPIVHEALGGYLRHSGLAVAEAMDQSRALELARKVDFDIAIIDIHLRDTDGFKLMAALHEIRPEMATVIISAHGDMDAVIRALRQGAVDFLRKPVKLTEIDAVIEKARQVHALREDRRQLRATIAALRHADAKKKPGLLIGDSAPTRLVREQIAQVARSNCEAILVTGETGTGKEVVARALHAAMFTSEAPFVVVSCPAITDTLVESEFFGHVRGSFTGATGDRAGCFSLADGGMLFLDEVGDLSPMAQASLLRVLETRTFRPVGAQRELTVRIRVVAATNAQLEEHGKAGRFRSDLFYRLNGYRIRLAPLRERREDILPLAQHFLDTIAARGGDRFALSERCRSLLESYAYPGNVRELRSIIERSVITAENGLIQPCDILLPEVAVGVAPASGPRREGVPVPDDADDERKRILEALEQVRWNRRLAAQSLGMPYSTFRYRLLRLGIR